MSRRSSAALAIEDVVPIFAALGDPTRLRIVTRLCVEGPLSITRLSEDTEVTRQAITRHLESLAHAGLVCDAKKGRERIWELAPQRLEAARACLDQISAQWDVALHRLKAHVEENP